MFDKLTEWLFGVLSKPSSTLNEIAREKPVGLALLVYITVTLLVIILNVYEPGSAGALNELMIQAGIYISPSTLVFSSLLLALVSLFISTGLLHLFARLFGGKGRFWNLFSAYAFADFPLIISVPVTVFSGFLGAAGNILGGFISLGLSIWVLVLHVIAVRESHGLSTGMTVLAYILHFLVLVAVPLAIIMIVVFAVFTF